MFEVPTAELPPGIVAEVIQAGYVIADRLLRPALVGVAKSADRRPAPAAGGSSTPRLEGGAARRRAAGHAATDSSEEGPCRCRAA